LVYIAYLVYPNPVKPYKTLILGNQKAKAGINWGKPEAKGKMEVSWRNPGERKAGSSSRSLGSSGSPLGSLLTFEISRLDERGASL
jgi:hypothetical protein